MIAKNYPQAHLLANNYNAGFAKANNQAIQLARGRYLLLLNPDMRVLPDTLAKMAEWMDEHQEAGIAGCKLIKDNISGEIVPHVRHFPTVWDQLAIVLKIPHFFPHVLNKYLWRDFDYAKAQAVDSLRGSFFMLRREVLQAIGGLDERYFIWFEEVDYCRRARAAGFYVMYTPAAVCLDYVGRSFVQVGRGAAQKYFRASMLKYFRKWHPFRQWLILFLSWPLGIFMAWVGDKIGFRGKTGVN
jgi:GT2 family glycosyltransferase